MTHISTIGTYLPPWGTALRRITMPDEDAVTLTVAAGRKALAEATAERVVLVTTELPLLEGGNGAAVLAGLGLPGGTEVIERNGGAAAALDAVSGASPGTLVIGVDVEPAGAAAALITDDDDGLHVWSSVRIVRSLPVRARGGDGVVHNYDDPPLLRERGLRENLGRLGDLSTVVAVAGLSPAETKAVGVQGHPELPTLGASSALFALAAVAEKPAAGTPHVGRSGHSAGMVLAADQASLSSATVTGTAQVHRLEPPAEPLPRTKTTPGPAIPISLAAYDRAFIPKLTLSASRGPNGTLVFPPRRDPRSRVEPDLVALPRHGCVYTTTMINVPVPGKATPYSLVIVELDTVGVRMLCQVTGHPAGEVGIGHRGELVFRLVETRSGVPDYGYAFLPHTPASPDTSAANELQESAR
jgi:uncharacterized OB-fold protein